MDKIITSHQLAKALLAEEDLPIMLVANSPYSSFAHRFSHGRLHLAFHYAKYVSSTVKHIVIGHMLDRIICEDIKEI